MALSKNQKIFGGIAIGVGVLLLINKMRKPKIGFVENTQSQSSSTQTVEQPKTATTTTQATTTSYKTTSYAEGDVSEMDLAKQAYKEIIGMAAYLQTSDDKLARDVNSRINTQSIKNGVPPMQAMYMYICKSKKGQQGLEGAKKIIGKNFEKHVDYFLTNKKLMVE